MTGALSPKWEMGITPLPLPIKGMDHQVRGRTEIPRARG